MLPYVQDLPHSLAELPNLLKLPHKDVVLPYAQDLPDSFAGLPI